MAKISKYPSSTDLEAGDEFILARSGNNYKVDYDNISAYQESVLAADFTLSQASGVYEDTGLSITLPGPGKYRISGIVRGALLGSTGSFWDIRAKLRNDTDGVYVSNSEIIVLFISSATYIQLSAPIETFVEVSAAKTYSLYAARSTSGGGTWTTTLLASSGAGRTKLAYHRL